MPRTPGVSESCLGNWLAEAWRAGHEREARSEMAELREAKKWIRLLEQENVVLSPAGAYLGQANLPKG